MEKFIAYLAVTLLTWFLLAAIIAIIFCITYNMHPSNANYIEYREIMKIIAGLMCVPAFFISIYIIDKKKL